MKGSGATPSAQSFNSNSVSEGPSVGASPISPPTIPNQFNYETEKINKENEFKQGSKNHLQPSQKPQLLNKHSKHRDGALQYSTE